MVLAPHKDEMLNPRMDLLSRNKLYQSWSEETVLDLKKDVNFLSDCIYTQVYLASKIIYNEKKFGFMNSDLLMLGGDGENFFGKNPSATNSEDLANRQHFLSNLRYQNFLIKVHSVSTFLKIFPEKIPGRDEFCNESAFYAIANPSKIECSVHFANIQR